jgi:hypothetical protein
MKASSNWLFCRLPLTRSRPLPATPDRSGLRPPFPVWPIRSLRLSALQCLTSLTDDTDYYALC